MRANAIVQEGKSFAAKVVDLPLLQEHQVYVRVSHAAFNPTDRLALDVNAFGDGAVLGCDFAGEVVEAHPSVTKFAKGSSIAGFIWGAVVGYFAIQLAKLHGYKVITTCSPRNFNRVKAAGATHVIDYNDEQAIARIRKAVPNLEYVLDTIGNATSSATASKALKDSTGRLCTVRPGKANTENVPSTVEVSDVFVFTAFPTAHTYRAKAHWPAMDLNRDGNVSAEKIVFKVDY
ncbi:hypothetical protein COL940_013843 [Colletotrichum noveboracense]|nr:hypothetical protein COL940_013843 [Colletotrichum noveboracense]